MRTAIFMKWDGLSPDQYEKMRKSVNWEGNNPKGLVFHVIAFDKNRANVTDVWESEAEFRSFVSSRLMPGAQQAGIEGEPQVETYPVHAIFAPAYEPRLRETYTSNSNR